MYSIATEISALKIGYYKSFKNYLPEFQNHYIRRNKLQIFLKIQAAMRNKNF